MADSIESFNRRVKRWRVRTAAGEMRFVDQSEAFAHDLGKTMSKRLRSAGTLLLSQIRLNVGLKARKLGGGRYEHSEKGEFPRRITGQLSRGLRVRQDVNKLTLTIASLAPHGPIVERTRPHIVRTYLKQRGKISKMLGKTVYLTNYIRKPHV